MNKDLSMRVCYYYDSYRILVTRLCFSDGSTADDEIDGDAKLVDPNVQDEEGKNVLRIAIENGSPIDLIMKLLDR